MVEAIFFYLFGGIALAAAVVVISSRQPVVSVLSLLVTMFALAALFVMLGAYVAAALQILLYAGAVLVLFLFVIMLLNLAPQTLARRHLSTRQGIGIALAVIFATLISHLFIRSLGAARFEAAAPAGTVQEIGTALFTTYLLPFELTSFLILAAIIGAITLSRSDK